MLKSISKKVGAVVLSAAMALSLAAVAPVSADAATAYTMTNKAGQEVEIGAASTYYVKGVKATQYVKVVPRGEAKSGITVKHQGKLIKATQKVKGTKSGTFGIVTTADESVAGKKYNVWVYIYNSKTATKPVKTLKGGAVTVKENKQVLTATQTGVKELTVKASKAIAAGTAVTVKKGSVDVAATAQIAADGLSVIITSAGKLTDGDYTITIGDASVVVKAASEKVAAIEFLTEKAILVSDNEATVGFKLTNQFGEDVTATTKAQVVANGTDSKLVNTGNDAYVKFTKATGNYLLTDVVACVLVYTSPDNTNVVTKSGTFGIANKASVSSYTVKEGIYDANGKLVELTEDTKLSKEYYVLVSAKDQYGRDIDVTTDNTAISLAPGVTGVSLNNPAPLTIDKVRYSALKLDNTTLKTGVATLILVSKGTGASTQAQINVTDGVKVDSLTITFPSAIYGDESNEVTYTALDTYGKPVTTAAKLAGVTGVSTNTEIAEGLYVKDDPITGVAKMYYKAASNGEKYNKPAVVTTTTATYKVASYQVSVCPDAKAVAIVGTKDIKGGNKFYNAAISGNNLTLEAGNFVLQDQYGREYKKTATVSYNTVGENAAFSAITPTAAGNGFSKIVATPKSDLTAIKATKLNFFLLDATTGKAIAGSDYDVTLYAAPVSAIDKYTVADVEDVFAGKNAVSGDYNKAITVKGTLANGATVEVPYSMGLYTVVNTGATYIEVSGNVIESKDLASDPNGALNKVDSVTEEVTVTINATGEPIKKTVNLLKAAPAAKTVEFTSETDKYFTKTAASDIVNELTVTDQYGVKNNETIKNTARVTFTNLAEGVTVTSNGTTTASINTTSAASGVVATATVTFANGVTFVGVVSK